MNKLTLLFFLSIAFFSCKSFDQSFLPEKELNHFKSAPLFGMVYKKNNQPCPNVDVTLYEEKDEKEKHIFSTKTDINGRFLLPQVKKGVSFLLFEKKGFETSRISFDFSSRLQVFYLQMISSKDLILMIEEAFDKKKWQEGKKIIERVFAIDPKNQPARLLMAVFNSVMGNNESATEVIEDLLTTGE